MPVGEDVLNQIRIQYGGCVRILGGSADGEDKTWRCEISVPVCPEFPDGLHLATTRVGITEATAACGLEFLEKLNRG
jgi:hypothetical protein